MKRACLVIASCCASICVIAQTLNVPTGGIGYGTAAGNVGINITNPATRLHIMEPSAGGPANGTAINHGVMISGNNTGGSLNLGIDGGGTLGPFYSWIQSRQSNSALYYSLALNPFGGNTGVGVVVPSEKLHVNGSLGIGKFSDAAYAGLRIEYTDGGQGTTVFKHMRWGGDVFFKREGSAGERTQVYLGGHDAHRIDIYNGADAVNVRLNSYGDSFFNGGHVGIGTTTPGGKALFVKANSAGDHSAIVENINSTGYGIIFSSAYDPLRVGGMGDYNGGYLKVASNGNVGIGTTSPNEKLTVNGTIYGKEVKVDLNVPGPDYVFEKNYDLPSLESVRGYIEEHKHLPEIPSAKDMEINGIMVGEMNMLLLKKVEELTLYMISQQAINDNQAKEISSLKQRVSQLQSAGNKK